MSAGADATLLMGLRASGKSTLGPALAGRLGAGFVDLDDRTRRLLGVETIGDAFESAGEARFRAAEIEALREALREARDAGVVVALGGGTPTADGFEETLESARSRGLRVALVYLHAPPEALIERLGATGEAARRQRPSLTGGDPIDEVDAVYARRDPVYRALADAVAESSGSPERTLERVLAAIGAG